MDPNEVNLSFDMGLCPECVNITYPGAIGFDQYLCAPGNDPEPFVSLAEPTGGDGPIEYLWMSTAGNPNQPIQTWQPIPNSNSPTYDPGPVFQTTYFARCARTEDCGTFLESNILEVTVGNEAGGDIASPGIACYNEPVTFQAVNLVNGGSVRWNFGPNAFPSTATGRTATTTFTSVGNFTVEMIVTVGDCDAFVYDQITISTLPTVCNQGLILGTTVTDNELGQVMLDWEMSASFEPLEYVVEYSDDGQDFTEIDRVTQETHLRNGIRYYEYITIAPKKGLNYYRVKVVDSAGNSVNSNIEEVIIYTESKIAMLYPNPVTDQLTVEIYETFDASDVSLEIFSVSGKRMASIPVAEGAKNVQFDMSIYPAGAYLVQLRLDETPIRTMRAIKR
ncbi:MAG: T9SS C-terminal target domain-containing protein [Bacteroidetes bacterium]|nr:MAG: T9SS C-terminal target domain-containing protein [Bacteroidota bacterium]